MTSENLKTMKGRLAVREGENPRALAEAFTIENRLPASVGVIGRLEKLIVDNMKIYAK